jgi:hypothetical protein
MATPIGSSNNAPGTKPGDHCEPAPAVLERTAAMGMGFVTWSTSLFSMTGDVNYLKSAIEEANAARGLVPGDRPNENEAIIRNLLRGKDSISLGEADEAADACEVRLS